MHPRPDLRRRAGVALLALAALGATPARASVAGRSLVLAAGGPCESGHGRPAQLTPEACGLLDAARQTDPGLPMRVGASDIVETLQAALRGAQHVRLATVLDACAFGYATADGRRAECVAKVTRVAALLYRDKAHSAETISDAGSTLTVVGLLTALVGYGHAAATSLRVAGFVAGVPIVTENALEMRPRARLYLISAMGLTALTQRYEDFRQLRALLPPPAAPGPGPDVCARVDLLVLSAQQGLDPQQQLVIAPEAADLKARCVALTAAEAALVRGVTALQQLGSDGQVARSLAFDAKLLDDQVALLDRELRASPTQAFRLALAAPFALVGKVLAGTSRPGDLSDQALTLFDKPVVIPLRAQAALDGPAPPSDPLEVRPEVDKLRDQLIASAAKGGAPAKLRAQAAAAKASARAHTS